MRFTISLTSLIITLGFAASLSAADWPQYRGPNANGISPEKGINKTWNQKVPTLLWKIPLSDNGYAGPAVADGKLFIIDHKGNQDIIRTIDMKTGKDVWTFSYPDTDRANYGFARSTPVYDEGNLYTLSCRGNLYCLDAKTGKPVWTNNIITTFSGRLPTWESAASPLIDGEKLILCTGGDRASVVALNKKTGETLWQGGGGDKMGYATPVIATLADKRQYLIFSGTALAGIDAQTGKRLWDYPWKTSYDINAANPIPVDNNTVFISSGYGHGSALLDLSTGTPKLLWQNNELQERFANGILFQGHIYSTSENGDLVCLDPQTGKSLWRQKGFEWGGLLAVDETLIVMDGKNGDVVMVTLTPTAYQELGRIKPLGGQSWTAPILSDGKLIIRNTKALVCLDIQ